MIWTVIRRTAYILQASDIRHDKRNVADKFLLRAVVSCRFWFFLFIVIEIILENKLEKDKRAHDINVSVIFNITLKLFYTITKKYKTPIILVFSNSRVKTTKLFSTDRMTLDTFFSSPCWILHLHPKLIKLFLAQYYTKCSFHWNYSQYAPLQLYLHVVCVNYTSSVSNSY